MSTELNSEEKTNTNVKNEDNYSNISEVSDKECKDCEIKDKNANISNEHSENSIVENNETDILKLEDIKSDISNTNKEYRKDIIFIISVFLAGIAYALIFTLGALIPNFNGISIPLAVFASLVTISFERNEWRIVRNHDLSLYDKFKPIVYSLGVLVVLIFTFDQIVSAISISTYVVDVLPNFISAGTLLGYFISYTIRQLIIYKRMNKGQQ